MKINRASVIEKQLNVKLSSDYKNFIDNYGDYEKDGFEIYGYTEDYIDTEKIPCVIGATKLYRKDYNLSPHEIVIGHAGFEDFIIVLDLITGVIYEKNMTGKKTKLAKSFEEWFSIIINKGG